MKRILFFLIYGFLLLITYHLQLATPASAQEEFATTAVTQYLVADTGRTRVSHTITLTNKFSTIYAVSYSFIIQGVTPTSVKAIENEVELPTDVEIKNNGTKINITFSRAVVGKDKSRTFTIEYIDEKTAVRNGQVWEITIPKIQDLSSYESYTTKLTVPKNFGQPAYLSPRPISQTESGEYLTYLYQGSQITQAGVVAAFGEFQIFNFSLAYHLKNPYRQEGKTEIALPPDTAFQRVYYETINPAPESVRIDEDGNWLASYSIPPGVELDIQAQGSVQLFAQPQEFYPKREIHSNWNLEASEFWQTKDPEIHELGEQLKTPDEIYKFIVNNLSYDYSRVRENVQRLGAKAILENPQKAICMEFTDLFVALARSAGIPAREINGFAYTDNPELQPLSLVADVLHAWPEYWDSARGVWIPVDPTWGATTGGVDYFSKFDLSHITFAIHGKDPNSPPPAGSYKLATNPQKDVIVYFGNLPEKRTPSILIQPSVLPEPIPFTSYRGKISVKNDGPVAVYNLDIKVEKSDGDIKLTESNIAFLPPFSKLEIPFVWTTDIFRGSRSFTILADRVSVSYTIPREHIFWQILGLFSILILTLGLLLSPLVIRRRLLAKKGTS